MSAVLRGKGLLDPCTGLPGRELLIDRLGHALARARTHGTLVSLVLVNGNAALARRLRENMREDHTVARYSDATIAIVAEHPYGSGEAIAQRVGQIAKASAGWHTSDGGHKVYEMILCAEETLP
jgi:GGDEF domain-containing protein